MVRSSFSIKFSIRESKISKDGTTAIEATITVNGVRCYFSTGKRVNIQSWDKRKQQVKGSNEEAKAINSYLKSVKTTIYQKESDLLERGFVITAELLQDAYFNKVEVLKERTFFEVFKEHNEQ